MNRDLSRTIKIIESKILHLEEVFHDLSHFLSVMDTESKEANTDISRQVNLALREIDNRFKELETQVLETQVLETQVLETQVLETQVLEKNKDG